MSAVVGQWRVPDYSQRLETPVLLCSEPEPLLLSSVLPHPLAHPLAQLLAGLFSSSLRRSSSSLHTNRIIAWNQLRNVFAVAKIPQLDHPLCEVYLNSNGEWLSPSLYHHVQGKMVLSMCWLPCSDSLVVGTNEGVCVWRIFGMAVEDNEQSWMSFSRNPNGSSVDYLQCSPQGRLFVTASHFDDGIHIWDSYLLTATSLSLGNFETRAMEWSPDGMHIIVGTRRVAVVLFLFNAKIVVGKDLL